MAREGTSITLPPFYGMTRRILLTAIVAFLALLVFGIVSLGTRAILVDHLVLHPSEAIGIEIWQFLTYPFINAGIISLLFAGLSFWFFGAALEEARGSRWLLDYFLVSTIGGGLLAALLSRFVLFPVPGFGPGPAGFGLWPAVMALLLAYARFYPEQEMRFYFVIRIRAKHLAALYLLVYLVFALIGGDRFGALLVLCAALAGYGFLRIAPRRGMRFAASEQWYGLRNAWYRRKRQQAAKKFTVYMRKQGKDVSLDSSGRYVSPDDERRDPNDKRWMN